VEGGWLVFGGFDSYQKHFQGMAWRGVAGLGKAWQGVAWLGMVSFVFLCFCEREKPHFQGTAWLGEARHGLARQGMAINI
jgi:hypothetical protein